MKEKKLLEIIAHLETCFKDGNWKDVAGLLPELESVKKDVKVFRQVEKLGLV